VDSWEAFTVEAESEDSGSVLALYRRLLELRRSYPALHAGDISEVSAADGVLGYLRTSGTQRIQVLLNMSAEEHWPRCLRGEILVNSHLDLDGCLVSDYVQLRPDEAVVILVS
jgi:alpha-glucosidase